MKKTVTCFIIAEPKEVWEADTGYVKIVNYFPWIQENYQDLEAIATVEVGFEAPDDLDYDKLKLQSLMKEKIKLQADFTARLTEIQSQINNLTAIEG